MLCRLFVYTPALEKVVFVAVKQAQTDETLNLIGSSSMHWFRSTHGYAK